MIDVTRTSKDTPTSVYRYYDALDALIYVGITNRGMTRNREHNSNAIWWPFVVRQEVDHYPNRIAAELAEKRLIQLHLPPFNRQHNPHHEEMSAQYLSWASFSGGVLDAPGTFRQLRNNLPMEPISHPMEGRFILRTFPEHFAVTRGLVKLIDLDVHAPKLIGKVEATQMVGRVRHLIVRVNRLELPPLDYAIALGSLRWSQDPNKRGGAAGPRFKLKRIDIFQLAAMASAPDATEDCS